MEKEWYFCSQENDWFLKEGLKSRLGSDGTFC